ncbi:hypothetical protein M409DRAFT_20824 [Zasmidium cellare ATCC 36951]|uniref:Linalool dehydratase/isomerase domain-containing protein n=1 Tax=Zasmidium cellare ATCC 36951 TaxID=1080233 RepID=A0A6A6CNE8_ZASCE|nr:uncharacterized protein M409DRAFT_20824 [Zasmidium cellare ATCC 36951]KAF2168807.1 hypothetical protein M409DRAFT_20824 [Zasmidium cellare ATCC 36951]
MSTTTTSTTTATPKTPAILPFDISTYPKLDHKQAGHLRHFHNLLAQPDGEWHHFGSQEPSQEWDDAYRYQLATMTYAMSVAHFHRLPILKGVFKPLVRRAIHKMLLRQVWGYWFNTSHAGIATMPNLKELRKPWADPIKQENIMYSGHLLLMTSLYATLFDDDEFEKEGSIKLLWNPLFWGFGDEEFVYDNRSVQREILRQMEENDWVGVCCEPNAVFVVCNQFPIIAMRLNDTRDGTSVVEGVLEKYQDALKRKKMVQDDGMYTLFYALDPGKALPSRQGAHTAWANAYMNSWNSKAVRGLYDQSTLGYITKIDGKIELQQTQVAGAFRKLVLVDGEPADSIETLKKARATISWGNFSQMLSELGKKEELSAIQAYADSYLSPMWENGGLYYPRNDNVFDKNDNLVHMEPHSGNSGIGYGRLNVEDGQKKIWENPWTRETLANRPSIEGITLADGFDFLRGTWDEERKAVIVTLKPWQDGATEANLKVENLPKGSWNVYVNGSLRSMHEAGTSVSVGVATKSAREEVNVVVLRQD